MTELDTIHHKYMVELFEIEEDDKEITNELEGNDADCPEKFEFYSILSFQSSVVT